MYNPGTDASIIDYGRSMVDAETVLDQQPERPQISGEVGFTGTQIFNGYLNTDEWVSYLKGVQLFITIDKMRTDAIIAAIERGFFLPIKQANYHVEFDDPAAIEDPENKIILDSVTSQFHNLNMSYFLHNACLAIPYGFSVFEQCYELNPKTGIMELIKLAPRLPKTIWRWLVDGHGNLTKIEQLVYAFEKPTVEGGHSTTGAWKYIPIPVEKILLITHQKEGGDFQGRSEYRPFYREWLAKDTTFKQIAVAIQRLGGGIPIAILNDDVEETSQDTTGGNTTSNEGVMRQVERVLQQLQAKESSYAVLRKVKELKNIAIDSNAMKGLIDLMVYCDQSMAKSAFQMFMSLGQTESGSRAVGQTFEGLYYESLYGIAEELSSPINEQVIKRFVDLNFGERKVYPKFHLEFKQDMSAIAETLSTLKKDGLIEGNTDLENFFLSYYGLPNTSEENKLKTDAPRPLFAEKHNHKHTDLNFAEVKMNRQPTDRESGIINFSDTANELNMLKKNFSDELRRAIEPKMMAAAKQLADGDKIYNLKLDWGNKVPDLYRKYYKKLLEISKGHIKKEIIKQNKKFSDRVLFAEKKKLQTESDYEKWANTQAETNSYLLENNSKTAIAKYYATGQAQGLEGSLLKDFIIDSIMSEKGQRYDTGADQVVSAYGNAREISSKEFSDIVSGKVRAEIFDNHICGYCSEQDGTEYTLAEDGEYYDNAGLPAPELPDHNCEGELGGNHCRGMWLYYVNN